MSSSPASSNPSSSSSRSVGVHFDGDLNRALLDAAIALHAEVGFEKLSLREVARRIGVSHAAPAHHFKDKAGLLTAIAAEGFELMTEQLEAAAAAPAPEGKSDLFSLGFIYVGFAENHPAHFDAMFQTVLINKDDARYLEASQAAYAALRHQVHALQESGWRPDADPTELTSATWALVHGLSQLRGTAIFDALHGDINVDDVMRIAATLTEPLPTDGH